MLSAQLPFYVTLKMQRANTNNHMARLDTLASMLKSEDFLTVRELSEALSVSPRTLYRDINILRERRNANRRR